jgi:hypothetical protein
MFEPEKIRPEKRQPNFFCDFQLSWQKRSGCTNFQAGNFWPEKISNRTSRRRTVGIFREGRCPSVVRLAGARDFFEFRADLPEFFRREERSYTTKISGKKRFGPQKRGVRPDSSRTRTLQAPLLPRHRLQ